MRDYCDAQAGFWLNSKFWSKFSRPKFTPEYPPPNSENFRFGMTKVYSGIPPPHAENFRFGMTKVYSRIPPQFRKLQIWDDQSLLRNTPPPPHILQLTTISLYIRHLDSMTKTYLVQKLLLALLSIIFPYYLWYNTNFWLLSFQHTISSLLFIAIINSFLYSLLNKWNLYYTF